MIKILFADDDLKYSMLLKSFLQQHGYDVTYAGNGKKAWEQFPEVKPDLVLLDINMPEMDGYEVAERIRAIDPKVLIFFLTDPYGEERSAERFLPEGKRLSCQTLLSGRVVGKNRGAVLYE